MRENKRDILIYSIWINFGDMFQVIDLSHKHMSRGEKMLKKLQTDVKYANRKQPEVMIRMQLNRKNEKPMTVDLNQSTNYYKNDSSIMTHH